ncbi:AIPR family protein [Neisseria cinerea]|uniref:AIPR family protein n=1 Tax=Neisseria cinerea TaxID=483 RepID=A0A7T3BN32_NEICI|nr:AIPR family protein [Neisseria cinerea]QPT38753.1 AIPR family protein [Neisseria cinerea]SQF83411.1 AIPR protein [Neisseria cinerea]
MKNVILNGKLNEFKKRHSISKEKEDTAFEKFVNYSILNAEYYDSFSFNKVSTGTAYGIDGVAIAINGIIVNDLKDEITTYTNADFDAKFTFIQTKTSDSFDKGDFLKFIESIAKFFLDDEKYFPPEIKKLYGIRHTIYERAAKLKKLPEVSIYYVYSGYANSSLYETIEFSKEQLRKQVERYVSKINCHIFDSEQISIAYREAQNEITKDFKLEKHITLPQISGTEYAYLGVIKCKDFVELISRATGEINKGLFADNVRDFLGNNLINNSINKTIEDINEKDKFALLNNGITIVAKEISSRGDIFTIRKFQIVNGCQTSHVIFNAKNNLDDNMYVTLKLIQTSDINLTNRIIETTNSQSRVMKEALVAINPYHRKLEDYFSGMRHSGYRYYYERRSHQFDDFDDITRNDIVTIPSLIKSFVSIMLSEPHKVHYYYGTLINQYMQKEDNSHKDVNLFDEETHPRIYFIAHHLLMKVSESINLSKKSLSPWRYHIAFLIKNEILPNLDLKQKYKDKNISEFLQVITDNFQDSFERVVNFLNSKKLTIQKDQNRNPKITKELIEEYKRKP